MKRYFITRCYQCSQLDSRFRNEVILMPIVQFVRDKLCRKVHGEVVALQAEISIDPPPGDVPMLQPSARITASCVLAASLAACPSPRNPVPSATASAAPPGATESATASLPAPVGPVAAVPDAKLMQELMRAVFGKQYRPASKDAMADLPDVKQRQQFRKHVLSAVTQGTLANGRMALVANAQVIDSFGNPDDSHASGGLLNVYILQKNGAQWHVLKKHENVAGLGSGGSFGDIEWLNLGAGHDGMLIHHGGTWQGYTVELISLFDLNADTMRDLSGSGILLHSDSEGGCGPDTAECWNISGKYSLAAGKPGSGWQDLLISFSGEKSVLLAARGKGASQPAPPGASATAASLPANGDAEKEPERSSIKINTRARYAFDGKVYRLVEGENPVPGI